MSKTKDRPVLKRHKNQCPLCDAFTTTGEPPTAHRTGCFNQNPDVMAVPSQVVRIKST